MKKILVLICLTVAGCTTYPVLLNTTDSYGRPTTIYADYSKGNRVYYQKWPNGDYYMRETDGSVMTGNAYTGYFTRMDGKTYKITSGYNTPLPRPFAP